jgi:hypothetical protein
MFPAVARRVLLGCSLLDALRGIDPGGVQGNLSLVQLRVTPRSDLVCKAWFGKTLVDYLSPAVARRVLLGCWMRDSLQGVDWGGSTQRISRNTARTEAGIPVLLSEGTRQHQRPAQPRRHPCIRQQARALRWGPCLGPDTHES